MPVPEDLSTTSGGQQHSKSDRGVGELAHPWRDSTRSLPVTPVSLCPSEDSEEVTGLVCCVPTTTGLRQERRKVRVGPSSLGSRDPQASAAGDPQPAELGSAAVGAPLPSGRRGRPAAVDRRARVHASWAVGLRLFISRALGQKGRTWPFYLAPPISAPSTLSLTERRKLDKRPCLMVKRSRGGLSWQTFTHLCGLFREGGRSVSPGHGHVPTLFSGRKRT